MVLDNPCDPDWRVLKEAATLTAAGFHVAIVAWDRTGRLPRRQTVGDARIFRVPVPTGRQRRYGQLLPLARFWAGALPLAARLGFDVVHCHDFPSLPVGVALAGASGRPLIYDAHEIYWLMECEKYHSIFLRSMRHAERVLSPRADRVLTVSEYLASYFRTYHRAVSVVGNWYDPVDLDTHARAGARAELGIPPDAFCLASIGSIGPFRLSPLLMEYAAVHPETYVLVAGRGPMEAELAAASRQRRNLRFVGWRADPRPLYAAADALFYGLAADSPYSRISSPNTLFLAIAMRIPLITTASGEAGAVVERRDAGEVLREPAVPALDACVRRLRDPARSAAVRERLAELQAEYSWRRAAAGLLDAYASAQRERA